MCDGGSSDERRFDDPENHAFYYFNKAIYGPSPYAMDALGEKDSVADLTRAKSDR